MGKPIIVESEDERKKEKHEADGRTQGVRQSASEAAQEKILVYQILKQQLDNLQSQAALLENAFMEVESSRQALKDLSSGAEKETLIPLGSGCYVHGKVASKGSVVANIGAGVMADKSISSALQSLEEKKAEIEKQFDAIQKNVQMLVSELNRIAAELGEIEKE